MNLEKLIKLVKLANNNPSDNEANLAARKVCKMIAEANYIFNKSKTETVKETVKEKSTTWDDMFRSREPWWSKQQNPSPFTEKFWEDLNRAQTNRSKENERYYSVDYDEPTKQESRRTCTKCGVDVATHNMDLPFVCGMCKLKEKIKP